MAQIPRSPRLRLACLLAAAFFCITPQAWASCASPAAEAGARQWFAADKTYKICDGSTWLDFAKNDTLTSCTAEAALQYDGTLPGYKVCDGANWRRMGCMESACTIASGQMTRTATNSVTYAPAQILVHDRTLYVLNTWNSVTAYDITDPSAPSQIGYISDDTKLYQALSFAISDDGDWLFVATGDSHLTVIDTSDPTNMAISTTFTNSALSGAVGTAVKGNYLYVSNWSSNKLIAFDITSPASLSYSDMTGSVSFSSHGGGNPGYIALQGNYIYLAMIETGMSVVDISTPGSPVWAGKLDFGTRRHDNIAVQGNYAYVSSNDNFGAGPNNSFDVIDVSDPANPVRVGGFKTGLDDAQGVSVSGNYAVIANAGAGNIVLADISNPAAPFVVDTLTATGMNAPVWVYFYGAYAYVASYDDDKFFTFSLGCAPVDGSTDPCAQSCGSLGSCSAAGEVETVSSLLAFCNGSKWISFLSPSSSVAAGYGDMCADGTVYAGISPDGNKPMFTTPLDAPGTYSFNKGTTSWYDTDVDNCYTSSPGTEAGCHTGRANTAILAAATDTGAPYKAAKYCADLVAYGKSDWYLPSADELNVLYQHRASIGGFSTDVYWSSSEQWEDTVRMQDFSDGYQGTITTKNDADKIRCVRTN